MSILKDIIASLKSGSLESINKSSVDYINTTTLSLLNKESLHTSEDIQAANDIIVISNILYNNTDRTLLPLEDGVYDLLFTLCKRYNSNFAVGAVPIHFKETNQDDKEQTKDFITPIKKMGDTSNFLYFDQLSKRAKPIREDFMFNPLIKTRVTSERRTLNTPHNYPKLVGTLNKCKFVLNSQAIERGVYNDSNVEIFERDFIHRHMQAGLIDPNREFYMVAELKYDGISVEADVSNKIWSARSRGDTGEDIASDLSPMLAGYEFHRAKEIPDNNIFGMKFEAIITYDKLQRLARMRGKTYKNARNAIIGIFGSLDCAAYKDYITLIPLATSLEMDRLTEIEFMNKYYNSGELLRYAILHGNYQSILFQVKRFVEEAEYMRAFIPYMYDGVVLSYIEPDLVDRLGRSNSVNNYSVAIKFNALKKQTIFRGYDFTVGQNGVITPMIKFNPVEFYGTIHERETGHSYARFIELGLKEGDIIDVEYTNDVMCYVTKPDNTYNRNNKNPVFPFPVVCPSCGQDLMSSDSGKSALCINKNCPDRNVARMANMIRKLNVKDFSEETIRKLCVFTFTELLNLQEKNILFLGEGNARKFIERMEELKTKSMPDYKIIGSLGFTGIAAEKWKLIMTQVSLQSLIETDDNNLYHMLLAIKGIGKAAAETICEERNFFTRDLITINALPNITRSFGVNLKKRTVRYSGGTDHALTEQLNAMGYDASETAGVTKTTDILIVPYDGYISGKTKKVGPNTMIITMDKAKAVLGVR